MKNKEIEELLNSIDEIIKGASDKAIYGIQIKEYKQIKNYIEQLKQESKNNKETYGDMLYELEQENEKLKKENKELQNIRKEALEFVEENSYHKGDGYIMYAGDIWELEEVLKGDMFWNEFCEISLDKMNELEKRNEL